MGDAPPPFHIIGANIFPSLGHEDVYLVEEDFYETRVVVAATMNEAGDKIVAPTTRRVLLARKGDALRISDARRLGLLKS